MKRDEGLTLIELVVVIAILAVMVSVVGISVSVVSRQRVSNAVADVKVLFQTAQTIAMSKDNCHIAIDQNDDGDTIFTLYSSSDGTVLNRVTISSKIDVFIHYGTSQSTPIGTFKTVNIYYDRLSGAFSGFYACGTSTYIGSVIPEGISGIEFSNGSSNKITLKLTKLTGRVSY